MNFRPHAAAALLGAAGATQAHTGHGHDELGFFAGLAHALAEPDHLAMLAAGIVVIALATPFVLRALAWLGRRMAAKARAARAPAGDTHRPRDGAAG